MRHAKSSQKDTPEVKRAKNRARQCALRQLARWYPKLYYSLYLDCLKLELGE